MMSCYVPDQYKHLKWHILRSWHGKQDRVFEVAEWVNNEENGPTEKGHWVRWGYCGDFPSLCQADYVGPIQNQEMLEEYDKSEARRRQASS
jgi:hypothetical protein